MRQRRGQGVRRGVVSTLSLLFVSWGAMSCTAVASASFEDNVELRSSDPVRARADEGLATRSAGPAWQKHAANEPAREVFAFSKFSDKKLKPELPSDFRFLPDETPGSRSLGSSTSGSVAQAVALAPVSEHWRILTRQRARDLAYGSEALISLLQDAAKKVADKHPQSVMLVGNIGREHGGPIRYSVSHNNGKDADIGFYTTDPEGRSVDAPDLLIYNDDGRSRAYDGYYRFDVPRNWSLVEALMESSAAELQYLFISNGLRALLLDYARAEGVSETLIAKAETLLRQPGVRAPHDDHLHVRIYCSREDILAGCEDFGAMHAWAPRRQLGSRAGVEHALSFLRDEDPEARIAAIARLELLNARGEAQAIAERLYDDVPHVRREAASAMLRLEPELAASAIGERLQQEDDAESIAFYLNTLGDLPGDESAQAITEFLRAPEASARIEQSFPPEKGAPLRLYAIDALAHSQSLLALPVLLEQLTAEDAEIRARAADAIAMVANQRPSDFEWASDLLDDTERTSAFETWRDWVESAIEAHSNRLDLALAGLRHAGYETPRRGRDLAASLARAAGDERPYIRINAQRMLMAMTDTHPASLEWPPEDARAYWTRWTERNPRRIASLR